MARRGEQSLDGTLGPLKVGIPHRTKILERRDGEGGASLIRLEAHKGRASWVLSDRFEVVVVGIY